MNKRLRELMVGAGYAAPELAGRAQRLANLIIRECAETADGMSNDVLYRGEAIMQHFGIDDETDWGKGYEVSTQEKLDEFVRIRNMSKEQDGE